MLSGVNQATEVYLSPAELPEVHRRLFSVRSDAGSLALCMPDNLTLALMGFVSVFLSGAAAVIGLGGLVPPAATFKLYDGWRVGSASEFVPDVGASSERGASPVILGLARALARATVAWIALNESADEREELVALSPRHWFTDQACSSDARQRGSARPAESSLGPLAVTF
jgi:hypothetical protein